MSDNSTLRSKLPLGCQSPVAHEIGRRPRAEYFVNQSAFCRACLELRIAESPTLVRGAPPPIEPLSPFQCHRAHSRIVPAAARLDSLPLCWDCLDAELRKSGAHTLEALKALDPEADSGG